MPRSFNQKLKILYLMKAFEEKTDREHPISVAEIIKYMDSYGISVERKAVYDDIETLRVFGMKIENRRGRPSGYFLADRKFELPELKILMDAVQSSRFLTQKQSRELLRKLESLTSASEARKLQYQTYTVPGVKSPNNEVYQNIQGIYDAIAENHQIGFLYYEWDFSKNLKQKRGGERYRVSPWKLQRQSVVHSAVQYSDNSIIAQLGVPDMRIPIQYALTYPARVPGVVPELDFTTLKLLTFDVADEETFRCLAACKKAIKKGGLGPCAANGANEEAVKLFLEDKIGFLDIGRLVEAVVDSDSFGGDYTLADVYECDKMARAFVRAHL